MAWDQGLKMNEYPLFRILDVFNFTRCVYIMRESTLIWLARLLHLKLLKDLIGRSSPIVKSRFSCLWQWLWEEIRLWNILWISWTSHHTSVPSMKCWVWNNRCWTPVRYALLIQGKACMNKFNTSHVHVSFLWRSTDWWWVLVSPTSSWRMDQGFIWFSQVSWSFFLQWVHKSIFHRSCRWMYRWACEWNMRRWYSASWWLWTEVDYSFI